MQVLQTNKGTTEIHLAQPMHQLLAWIRQINQQIVVTEKEQN